MKRHAKAATAGSTQRQASGLGRFVRGALATRGASTDAKGSGAPATARGGQRIRTALLSGGIATLALLSLASQAFAAKTTVNTFGTVATGVTGGLFNQPRGVALNRLGVGGVPAGTLYVVDGNNNRIQRFGPAGAFVSAWGWGVATNATAFETCTVAASCLKGKAGAGAGQFGSNGAQGIAIDQVAGTIYVSDQVERRIDVFSSTGTFFGAFGWGVVNGAAELQFCTSSPAGCAIGTTGAGAGQFGAAIGGLAVDSSGNLYVADKTNRRVDVFKPFFVSGGAVGGVAFTRAFGWGVDTGANAFETCTTASICNAGSTAAPGNQKGQFATNSPLDVAVDSEGHIFTVDNNTTKRVQEFDTTPTPLNEAFGGPALSAAFGTGELQNIAIDVSSTPNHVLVSGKRSAEGSKVAVAELDGTGASIATHGVDLAATVAAGLADAPAERGGSIYLSSNSGAQRVYVLNEGPSIDPVTTFTGTTATFSGEVVSNGQPVKYHFEFSGDGVIWRRYPAADVSVPATPGKVAVTQNATGITGGQLTHVRLAQSQPLGEGATAYSPETTYTPPVSAPDVTGMAASAVGASSALLEAEINPELQATTYHFEYGLKDCAANPCASLPVPDANLGSGGTFLKVKQQIGGLSQGTTYHFRVVATNTTGTTAGPDHTLHTFAAIPDSSQCPNNTFRVGPAVNLPDCRAYEMVSPVEKNGIDVGSAGHSTLFDIALNQAASDGNRVTYTAAGSFADQPSAANANQYIATRGAAGWSTHGINPPMGRSVFEIYDPPYLLDLPFQAFTEDLSSAWVINANRTPLAPGAIDGFGNLYRRESASGAFEALTVAPPPTVYRGDFDNQKGMKLEFRGASADLRHQVFDVKAALTDDASTQLYIGSAFRQVYDYAGGDLHLVSVLPNGEAAPQTTTVGAFADDSDLVSAENSREGQVQGAVSRDGSRIFWSTHGAASASRVYVRENPDRPQSALANGGATGFGLLTNGSNEVTAVKSAGGKVTFTLGSPVVTQVKSGEWAESFGRFVPGQPVIAPGFVPPGTTVVAVEKEGPGKFSLVLSANAEASGTNVPITSVGPAPFAVGQTVSGRGIPPNTTITAVGPGSLTLSAAATQASLEPVLLVSWSQCTEPAKACTLPVSDTITSGKAEFWAANPAGSKVLFTGRAAQSGLGASPGEGNLYKYNVDAASGALIAPQTLGLLGASTDLSYVYFVSTAELAPGAVAGEDNLYLDHEGTTSLVATLVKKDLERSISVSSSPRPVALAPFERNSRVAPDGRHIAFVSSSTALAQSVAGYDNSDAVTGEPDAEVYAYEAGGGLTCVSCNPSGARPVGSFPVIPHKTGSNWNIRAAAWIPTWGHENYAERVLSDDGGRLFFNSLDPLVTEDNNGRQDVYEWEAAGVGTCEEGSPEFSQQDDGCVSLISTGHSAKDSEFVDASADGGDVFFTTESSIDPRDPGLVDIYDARVGGGYPPPASEPGCSGDTCQTPPEAPRDATPASAAFRGAGNPAAGKARHACRHIRNVRKGKAAEHGKRRCKRSKRRAAR